MTTVQKKLAETLVSPLKIARVGEVEAQSSRKQRYPVDENKQITTLSRQAYYGTYFYSLTMG
jgi:hypothetical protein